MKSCTNLNPVSAVGVFSEVRAAGMTRGNVLDVVRAAHGVEGTVWTGAVSVAQGQRSVEGIEAEHELVSLVCSQRR